MKMPLFTIFYLVSFSGVRSPPNKQGASNYRHLKCGLGNFLEDKFKRGDEVVGDAENVRGKRLGLCLIIYLIIVGDAQLLEGGVQLLCFPGQAELIA